jgi:hypothetical protein
MNNADKLFVAAAILIKDAATAPSNMGGTGTMPMASMMQQMSSSVAKSPLEATSMNPMGASGGMLAQWGSKMNMPLASLLNNWKMQMASNKGRALF